MKKFGCVGMGCAMQGFFINTDTAVMLGSNVHPISNTVLQKMFHKTMIKKMDNISKNTKNIYMD